MSTVNIPGCQLSIIPTELIEEGERFRKDYGDLTDLCHSIKTQGLINPIAVLDKTPEGKYPLIAGGRRLKACQNLVLTEVPVRIFTGEVSDLDLRILELAENIQRKDMTWQEANQLQREIHRLQQEKFGKAVPGVSGTGWRMDDTAAMLGVSRAQVTNSVQLMDKLEKFRDIIGDPQEFRTENDAVKAVKKVEEAILRAELVKRATSKLGNPSNAAQKVIDSYQVGDCIEKMKSLQSETFDFAEIDPPYAIDLDNKKEGGTYFYREIPKDEALSSYRTLLEQVFRVLKQDTFAILWFGPDPWFEPLYQISRDVGFSLSRLPLIWTKPNGQSMAPNSNLANYYEMAFYLKKGSPVLAQPGRGNIFSYTPVAADKKRHSTEKPIELYDEIYRTFSFERAYCLVPYAGSGASILAAYRNNRQAIGYDIIEENKGGFIQKVHETLLSGAGHEGK